MPRRPPLDEDNVLRTRATRPEDQSVFDRGLDSRMVAENNRGTRTPVAPPPKPAGAQAPDIKVGKSTALILIADDDPKNRENDLAMATLLYGCARCILRVSSFADMNTKLREFDNIGQLVFLLHGITGEVGIRGTFMDLRKVAKLLEGAKTKVEREVVFESCNVAGDPASLLPIIAALHAPKARGYAAFHAWGPTQPFEIKKGDSAEALDAKLRIYKEYLLPNQPDASELVRTPGKKVLFVEWFSRSLSDDQFPISEPKRAMQPSRSRLVNKPYSATDARTAAKELMAPGGPFYAVTVLAPPIAPAKKP